MLKQALWTDFLCLYDTIICPSCRESLLLAVSRTLIDFHLYFNTLRSHGLRLYLRLRVTQSGLELRHLPHGCRPTGAELGVVDHTHIHTHWCFFLLYFCFSIQMESCCSVSPAPDLQQGITHTRTHTQLCFNQRSSDKRRSVQDWSQMVTYDHLLFVGGKDYISRFKLVCVRETGGRRERTRREKSVGVLHERHWCQVYIWSLSPQKQTCRDGNSP